MASVVVPTTSKSPSASSASDLQFDLLHQSVDATNGHAQGSTPLTPQQQQQIVAFEMGLSTAQAVDFGALGKVDDIDPAEGVVGTVSHKRFDRRDRVGIRRLPQYGEESLGFAHAPEHRRRQTSREGRCVP